MIGEGRVGGVEGGDRRGEAKAIFDNDGQFFLIQ